MFRAATLAVINKIDLLPYVDFDVDTAIGFARDINPDIEIILTSARTGEGMREWYDFVRARVAHVV
jgi:hydrogenase nickel incorporation protein HypB